MRTNPSPATHDTLAQRKADGTDGITQKVNDPTGAYVKTKDAQIVVNNGTTDVIIIGRKSPEQTYGMVTNDGTTNRLLVESTGQIKISQPGIDVKTATDSQLIFNSNNNLFKIIASSTATVAVTTGASADSLFQTSVAHGQSFRPAILAFVTPPVSMGASLEQIPYYFFLYDAGTTSFQTRGMARAYIDDTNITFYVRTNNGSLYAGNWVFRYYLLQETSG